MISLVKRISIIFDKKTKLKFLFVLFLILIKSLLDGFGIGLIIPFVASLSNPEIILNNYYFAPINNLLIKGDETNLILFFSLVILIFFICKNIINVGITYYISKFTFLQRTELSSELFSLYLNAPYSFYLNNNTAKLNNNLIYEVSRLYHFITNFLNLVSSLIFSLIIFIIILFADWKLVLIGGLIISFFSLINIQILGKRSKKLGDEISKTQLGILKTIKESLSSIIETKIYNAQNIFVDKYFNDHYKNARSNWTQATLSSVPHLIFEVLTVMLLILFIIIVIQSKDNFINYLPIFAMLSVAFVRLIPSLTTAIKSFQELKFSTAGVNSILYEIINTPREIISNTTQINDSRNNEINIINLSFGYTNKKIINNFNFKIKKGNLIGIFGKSGCGKTTLINLIIGFLTPDNGSINFNNVNISEIKKTWRNSVGYVSQNFNLLDSRIIDNIIFGKKDNEVLNINKVIDVLHDANLSEFASEDEKGLYKLIGENGNNLSGGQKQRLVLARALYNNPKILVFDEPTSALDEENEMKIINLISNLKKDKIIFVISHSKKTLTNCDRIINFLDYDNKIEIK